MRRLLALVALLLAAAQPSAAAALHFVLEKSGGNGFAIDEEVGAHAFGFSLFGNSAQTGTPTWTSYSTTVGEIGDKPLRVSGDWSYISYDKRGAYADTFGIVLNGMKTELFDKAGSASQAGAFSLLLATGDVFGWYVDSVDGAGGRAMVGVSASVAPIPLPAAGLLLVGGMAVLGAAARRRQARA